jgi:guanylate kinase
MLISLTGPSGIGKGYIKRHLLRIFPELQEVVWLTTRPLRQNETTESSNREHIVDQEFQSLINQGKVLFAQRLYGHCYGVRKDGHWLTGDRCWLVEFHIGNLLEARKSELNLFAIGLIPDGQAILRDRLMTRGSEDTGEIQRRLEASNEEICCIQQNRHLFDEVFTVSTNNEHQICSIVSQAIERRIKG